MAGLWESKSGVFAKTPAEASEPAAQLSTELMYGVVAAVVGTLLLRFISHKLKPKGWGLRNHLGTIGAVITLAYLAVVLPLIQGRIDTLLTMPLNEVGDFLAGAFGPVAFMWLVLGFLQQGEELRQGTEALKLQAKELSLGTEAMLLQAKELKSSVDQQSIMADAALQQIEEQRKMLQHQLDEKDRALRAHFMPRISRSPTSDGNIRYGIELENIGKSAYLLHAVFNPPLSDSDPAPLGDVSSSGVTQFSQSFNPDYAPSQGTMTLHYDDSEGNRRSVVFTYTVKDRWLHLDRGATQPKN